jgi:hypothetical protein
MVPKSSRPVVVTSHGKYQQEMVPKSSRPVVVASHSKYQQVMGMTHQLCMVASLKRQKCQLALQNLLDVPTFSGMKRRGLPVRLPVHHWFGPPECAILPNSTQLLLDTFPLTWKRSGHSIIFNDTFSGV